MCSFDYAQLTSYAYYRYNPFKYLDPSGEVYERSVANGYNLYYIEYTVSGTPIDKEEITVVGWGAKTNQRKGSGIKTWLDRLCEKITAALCCLDSSPTSDIISGFKTSVPTVINGNDQTMVLFTSSQVHTSSQSIIDEIQSQIMGEVLWNSENGVIEGYIINNSDVDADVQEFRDRFDTILGSNIYYDFVASTLRSEVCYDEEENYCLISITDGNGSNEEHSYITEVNWPDYSIAEFQKGDMSAHEIFGHGFDYASGYNPDKMTRIAKETNAINIANIWMKRCGRPERIRYDLSHNYTFTLVRGTNTDNWFNRILYYKSYKQIWQINN